MKNNRSGLLATMLSAIILAGGMLCSSAKANTTPTNPPTAKAINADSAGVKPPLWVDNLNDALENAAANYRPVFVVFTSPHCSWCNRYLNEINNSIETLRLLNNYTTAIIDVSQNQLTARQFQITGVPASLILASDGSLICKLTGYLPPAKLIPVLRKPLNPKLANKLAPDAEALLAKINAGSIASNQWQSVMLLMGKPELHKTFWDAIIAMPKTPAQPLANLLQDPRLAVRLGSIDILEELKGDTLSFDPWLPPDSPANQRPIQNWQAWAAGTTGKVASVYITLSAQAVERLLQQVIGNDLNQNLRAMRMLQTAGPSIATSINTFLKDHPKLPAGAVQRIKEVQYSIWLPSLQGVSSRTLAHHLTFGTIDLKLDALRKLSIGRQKSLPILRDFLNSPEAIIRETTVESILKAGRAGAIPLIADHLKNESDVDVTYAVLRELGKIRSKRSLKLLTGYTTSKNEDLAIIALASLGQLKSKLAIDPIATAVNDPRWRVRVAAIEAAGKLKYAEFTKPIMLHLSDQDSFVKHTAIKTITMLPKANKVAAPKLKAMLKNSSTEKAVIIAALTSLGISLPPELKKDLTKESKDSILAILSAMEGCKGDDLKIVMPLASHPDNDIACAALRLLADEGYKQKGIKKIIIRALESGTIEQQRIAMEIIAKKEKYKSRSSYYQDNDDDITDIESTTISLAAIFKAIKSAPRQSASPPPPATSANPGLDQLLAAFDPQTNKTAPNAASPNPAVMPKEQIALDDILTAFDTPSNKPKPNAASTNPAVMPKKQISIDDLLAEFDAPTPKRNSITNNKTPKKTNATTIENAVAKILKDTSDPELKVHATIFMLLNGKTNNIPSPDELKSYTTDERADIAYALVHVHDAKADLALQSLLNDSVRNVRYYAANSCLCHYSTTNRINLVFDAISKTNAVLQPYDCEFSGLAGLPSSTHEVIGHWCSKYLQSTNSPKLTIAATIIASKLWKPRYINALTNICQHPNPWVRCNAYYVIGKKNRPIFYKLVPQITKDTSEFVRIILPLIYSKNTSYWSYHYDEKHYERSWSYISISSSSRRKKIPEPIIAELHKMTKDSSPKVRIEAYLCLLSYHQPINIQEFKATINNLPNRSEVINKISSFIVQDYRKLGPEFAELLPYLDESRQIDSTVKKVYAHFHKSRTAGEAPPDYTFVIPTNRPPTIATFQDVPATNQPAPKVATTTTLIFFSSPGCSDCARVKQLLDRIHSSFPHLNIINYSIKKSDAMILNEALCSDFNVPTKLHLVSPALFGAGGALVKHEITADAIATLLASSARLDDGEWFKLQTDQLQSAKVSITERQQSSGLLFVLFAAFIDGINPCAFATIIFLLSYLQVSKRAPREILQVGIAFITGVFLAYFALGLGLHEIVSKIKILQRLGHLVDWTIAGFAIIIAVLSIRDGILCLRGRITDMTLQLPGVLKSQIHTVIRKGSRHRRFIIAAFLIGIAISFLELACTGQVYLPTILFVLETAPQKSSAIWMLFLYNTVFIIPLVIIFGLAYGGLRSDTLTKFMHKHAAAVKFATAFFFILLFIFFAFGDQLLALKSVL